MYQIHSLGQHVYWCKSLMALSPAWGIAPDGFIDDPKLNGTMTGLQVRPLTEVDCYEAHFALSGLCLTRA